MPAPVDWDYESQSNQFLRLHPSSLLFDLIAHSRAYLVPAAVGLWGATQGDMTFLIISAVIFVPVFLTSVFRYFTFRYQIADEHLIIRKGLVFQSDRTVPISRIQNIDFVQNPLHRVFGVAEIKIETASGTKPEANMRVLSMAQLDSLRQAVFAQQKLIDNRANGNSESQAPVPGLDSELGDRGLQSESNKLVSPSSLGEWIQVEDKETTLLEIPTDWLIKAGLASNRGMILIGIIVGAIFPFVRPIGAIGDFFESLSEGGQSITALILISVLGTIGILLLLRLLGVAWFVLRFHGYKLVRHGDDMRISCGLLTRVSATVPRQRIQFISIHRTLFMRMMGVSSIRIETAGGAGTDNENATETVSKRWFVPVIRDEQVSGLLSELRPGLDWDESAIEFQALAPKVGRRLCRAAVLQGLLILGIGIAISRPWGWIAGVVLMPMLVLWALKKSKSMRYAQTENGVVYRTGVFTRKISMTFFEKIQTLRVDQSPFDRRWKMAKLCVDTAAAGPADHQVFVSYLDEQFAQEELQRLRLKTGQQQAVFG
jgi:putative membrane protein